MAGINETISQGFNSFVDTTDRLVQDGLNKWDRFSEERKIKGENTALRKEIDAICREAGETAYREFKETGNISPSLLEESFVKALDKEKQIEENLNKLEELKEAAKQEAEKKSKEKEEAKSTDFNQDNAEFWGGTESPYAKYQTGGKIYCPVCGGENYRGYLFCVKCGRSLQELKKEE